MTQTVWLVALVFGLLSAQGQAGTKADRMDSEAIGRVAAVQTPQALHLPRFRLVLEACPVAALAALIRSARVQTQGGPIPMSVRSFPRIYFNGYMAWDPATGNNNDYFPTYADVEAALNWEFFKQQDIDIDPSNFRETFRPWVIQNQTIPGFGSGIPGEWNDFGGNACSFVDYEDPAKWTMRTRPQGSAGRAASPVER